MKLDYISSEGLGAGNPPIVRLYEFSAQEVVELIQVFTELADGKLHAVVLQNQRFIQPLDGISFVLRNGHEDIGMKQIGKQLTFECELTADSWRKTVALSEVFLDEKAHGYQWLVESPKLQIEFLLSKDGSW
jgi:hypothetical protein